MAFAVFILSHILHFLMSIYMQNSESLENRCDEVLRLTSSLDDVSTTCGSNIRNTRTIIDGGLSIVNSD